MSVEAKQVPIEVPADTNVVIEGPPTNVIISTPKTKLFLVEPLR